MIKFGIIFYIKSIFKRMKYYITKKIASEFDEAISILEKELKNEGFGILTDIDIKDTLKDKIGVDFRKYRILGACNPKLAHEALVAEDKIGVLLPCNFIVQEIGKGNVEIACINPLEAMKSVDNEKIRQVANAVTKKLTNVLEVL